MSTDPSRREWMAGVAGTAALAATSQGGQPVPRQPKPAFGFCLNTSTVRDKDGKSRPITELIDIAAKAGYDAVEPWTSEIDEYLKKGGSLKELRKQIEQCGLKVPDVIGFAEWIVEDPERRKKGLEQAKRDIDWRRSSAARGSPPRRSARRAAPASATTRSSRSPSSTSSPPPTATGRCSTSGSRWA